MTTIFESRLSSLPVALLILRQHQLFHSHHEKSAVALQDMASSHFGRDTFMDCYSFRLTSFYLLD